MIKIITVVGARPQFVKAAALSPALQAIGGIEEKIIHTGQHFDHSMSDIFFEEMGIPAPHFNLGIGGGSHGQNTGRMIEALESVFLEEAPDAVLVYGDTDSTLAAAIAAAKLGITLAHVEAGLRSFRRAMPEEINRVLTDHVADVLYAPSQVAVNHLHREGIAPSKVVNSGDIMLDVVKRFQHAASQKSRVLADLGLSAGNYDLMTLHRKENVDDSSALAEIFRGIESVQRNVVFLVHPRTTKRISEFGISIPKNIQPVAPVGYLDMLQLLAHAELVLTDSGGLQKEAYFLDKPCITLRDETEWIELVDAGVNILTGSDPLKIEAAMRKDNWPSGQAGIYGIGDTGNRIAADLFSRLKG